MIFVALLLLCWVVLFTILKWWFPNQLVVQYALNYIQKNYQVHVEIDNADIDPFANIVFNGIRLKTAEDRESIIQIESIRIGYKFLPLLFHRQLKIEQILVDSPHLEIRTCEDGRWNFEQLLSQFVPPDSLIVKKTHADTEKTFPVEIDLKKVEINNITVAIMGNTPDLDVDASLGPIDVKVMDVTGNSLNNLNGKVIVRTPDSFLSAKLHQPIGGELQCGLNSTLTTDIDPKHVNVTFQGHLLPNVLKVPFADWHPKVLPDVNLFINADWNRRDNIIACTSFNITSDPFHVDMQAETTLDSIPNWSFHISPNNFDIASIIDHAISLNLSDLEGLDQLRDISGVIELNNLTATGCGVDPKSEYFQVSLSGAVSIDIPTFSISQPVPLQVKEFANAIEFGANLSGKGFKSAFVNIDGGIAEIQSDSIVIIISVDSITWNTQLVLDGSKKQLKADVTGRIANILDGTCELAMQSTIDLPQLLNQYLEAIKKSDIRCTAKDIDLDQIGRGKWGGVVTAELQINADNFTSSNGDGKLILLSPWALISEQKVSLPDIEQTANFHGQIDIGKKHIAVTPIHWEWLDIASADIFAESTYPNFRIETEKTILNLAKLYSIIPRSILPQFEMEFPSGVVQINAIAQGSIEDISHVKFEVNAGVDSVKMSTLQPELSVENIQANLELSGGMQSATGMVQLSVDQGGIPNMFPNMLESVSGVVSFQYRSPNKFIVDSLNFKIPAFAVSGNGSANIDIEQTPPNGLFDLHINMNDSQGKTILDTVNYIGNTSISGRLFLHQNQVAFNGEFDFSDVDIRIGSIASVKGLTGRILISQKYDLSLSRIDMEPLQRIAHRAMGLNSYPSLQTSYRYNMEDYGTIGIDSFQVMDYGISNLTTDIMLKSGYLEIPSFQCKAYGGNLHGDLWVSLKDLNPDSLQCGVRMNAAGIQTAKIVASSKHDSMESIICADADLVVSGFPGTPGFNIQGSADVTRIGRGVALDLLQIMDPEGQDEGIQSTRTFLRQGWGVKVFSFRIRDGFVYSSMVPSAPPPSKLHMFLLSKIVHLPPQITYGRIPLKFLLQMQGTEE